MSALLSAPAPALADPVPTAAFQAILDRYLEREDLAGGVLLVSSPQQRIVVASGVANRRTGAAVTPDSRFYAASVGKMSVATAALQLVEDGKLSLDASVASLAGGIPNIGKLANARAARVENLLNHSSGIPEYLTEDFLDFHHAKASTLTPAVAMPFAFDEPATGRVGKAYEYCNSNYVLLGEIIGTADGTSFEASLQRRVLDRAGMGDTTVGARNFTDARLAHGYADIEDSGKEQDVSRYVWSSPLGDGPLVTTAADLEKFLFALFRDGKLLKPATLARMTEASALEDGYGMGVQRDSDRWGPWFGHTGLEDGFEAEVRYYPESQTAFVFLTNGNSTSDTSILDKAAATLFQSRKSSR
ncbi:serine hydrolase domain-containing protein [Paramagnetospirillum marisnigri]|uniref:serine hydrolase domain-containing protein n=1 Tax=Paramagnetospirillum marisnigri TaxID=1285242 RepID=UPI001FE0FC88|nr:serine hydrolase domain-containing protein [Paramagnetospirillum marisnigri]